MILELSLMCKPRYEIMFTPKHKRGHGIVLPRIETTGVIVCSFGIRDWEHIEHLYEYAFKQKYKAEAIDKWIYKRSNYDKSMTYYLAVVRKGFKRYIVLIHTLNNWEIL